VDLGVLVSGSGTNLQAILDAVSVGQLHARVRVVVSSKDGVLALERARRAGVPTRVLTAASHATREAYDFVLRSALEEHGVEAVALAGFMRLLTPGFLAAFPERVLNIHPALLPAFPGLHAARQALAHGAKVTGCTVHFVDAGVDTGPIIAQAALPIRDDDDEASLQARIQTLEHRLYPAVLEALSQGRIRVDGRRVSILGSVPWGEHVASLGVG
jgi:phosphoribosylglycinamide formyltransferase-1